MAIMQFSGLVLKLFTLFSSFLQGKWSWVDLIELWLTKITEATHQNIKMLCSGVVHRNQTLLPSISLHECMSNAIQPSLPIR